MHEKAMFSHAASCFKNQCSDWPSLDLNWRDSRGLSLVSTAFCMLVKCNLTRLYIDALSAVRPWFKAPSTLWMLKKTRPLRLMFLHFTKVPLLRFVSRTQSSFVSLCQHHSISQRSAERRIWTDRRRPYSVTFLENNYPSNLTKRSFLLPPTPAQVSDQS